MNVNNALCTIFQCRPTGLRAVSLLELLFNGLMSALRDVQILTTINGQFGSRDSERVIGNCCCKGTIGNSSS